MATVYKPVLPFERFIEVQTIKIKYWVRECPFTPPCDMRGTLIGFVSYFLEGTRSGVDPPGVNVVFSNLVVPLIQPLCWCSLQIGKFTSRTSNSFKAELTCEKQAKKDWKDQGHDENNSDIARGKGKQQKMAMGKGLENARDWKI